MQVFGTFRWGVICLIQASAHLNGTINSVEKAAIGRRVSETEIDIVDLLFFRSVDDDFDKPDSVELLDAVNHF